MGGSGEQRTLRIAAELADGCNLPADLDTLDRKLETRQPFHIICGYRSPATNEYLREHTAGVAKHSMHMQAKAVDVRIPGCRLVALQRAALALRDGGVGIYPVSEFVHVDVGRVRQWRFPAGKPDARPPQPPPPGIQ